MTSEIPSPESSKVTESSLLDFFTEEQKNDIRDQIAENERITSREPVPIEMTPEERDKALAELDKQRQLIGAAANVIAEGAEQRRKEHERQLNRPLGKDRVLSFEEWQAQRKA